MKISIFSIYDIKAKAFITPFFLPTYAMALRVFTDCVNDPKHAFGKNPHDYTLQSIGEFDDQTGIIINGPEIASMPINGLLCVESEEE